MMRALAFASLMVLAACSENAGTDQKAAEADKSKLELAAGQWETVSEMTSFKTEDQGPPAIEGEAGNRTTLSNCVGQGEGKKPPAAILAGLDNASCEYQNIYMSRGRLNASITCRRPGLSGDVLVSVEGSYTGNSFDLTSNSRTLLTTDGDVSFDSKVTGRHTGACAAPAGAGA